MSRIKKIESENIEKNDLDSINNSKKEHKEPNNN